MKKYSSLTRAFLLSYICIIFGAMLFGLLLMKDTMPLAFVIFGVCALDLACVIVARTMFNKHYHVFFILTLIGFGVLNALVLGAFITEIVYTVQGHSAPYAWMVGSVSLALIALMDFSFYYGVRKIHYNKLVEEGIIKEVEEDI